jgi:hypothetical protein
MSKNNLEVSRDVPAGALEWPLPPRVELPDGSTLRSFAGVGVPVGAGRDGAQILVPEIG